MGTRPLRARKLRPERPSSLDSNTFVMPPPVDQKIPEQRELDDIVRLAKLYCYRYESEHSTGENILNDSVSREKLSEEITCLEEEVYSPGRLIPRKLAAFRLSFDELRIAGLLFAYATFDVVKQRLEQLMSRRTMEDMTVRTLLNLIDPDTRKQAQLRKHFSIGAPMVQRTLIALQARHDTAENILDMTVYIRSRICNRILGDENIYSTGETSVRWEYPEQPLEALVLPRSILSPIEAFLANYPEHKERSAKLRRTGGATYGLAPTFLLYGLSGTGKTMLARGIATKLGKKLMTLRNSDINTSRTEALRSAFIEAQLQDAVLYFDECDDLFEEDTAASRTFLIEVEQAECIVILSTNNSEKLDPALERRILYKYEIPFPDTESRRVMWSRFLKAAELSLPEDVTEEFLAERFAVPGGHIKNCVTYLAALRERDGGKSVRTDEVLRACDYFYKRYQYCLVKETPGIPLIELARQDHDESEEKPKPELVTFVKALKAPDLSDEAARWLGGSVRMTFGVISDDIAAAARELCTSISAKGLPSLLFSAVDLSFFGGKHDLTLSQYARAIAPARPVLVFVIDDPDTALLKGAEFHRFWSLTEAFNQPRAGVFSRGVFRKKHPPECFHFDHLLDLTDSSSTDRTLDHTMIIEAAAQSGMDVTGLEEELIAADFPTRTLQSLYRSLLHGTAPATDPETLCAFTASQTTAGRQRLFG